MNIVKWLNNIADSFQPAYDKIKRWKLPPNVDKLFEEMWDNLAPSIQTAIWNFLKMIYEKYGEEAAKDLLRRILEAIKIKGYVIR